MGDWERGARRWGGRRSSGEGRLGGAMGMSARLDLVLSAQASRRVRVVARGAAG